jgi:sulfoxide reductase heme-binding subunit YedZ
MPLRLRSLAQLLLVALGLVPLGVLLAETLGGRLSANPIEDITHRTGDWTLYLLLATLAVTPLRRLAGWGALVRFRRTLGLLAFSYACLHFLTYVILDRNVLLLEDALADVVDDVMKRPYITVGFTAFLLLLPLALTSTNGWVRRLGGRRWNALHRLIYIAAALGVLHFLWLVKGEQVRPVWFGVALVVLLAARVVGGRRRTKADRGGQLAVPAADHSVRPRPPLTAPVRPS